MHDWILVDIIEEYKGQGNSLYPVMENVFVGHKYLLWCYSCKEMKIVREDTFNKMIKYGLLEEVEKI